MEFGTGQWDSEMENGTDYWTWKGDFKTPLKNRYKN